MKHSTSWQITLLFLVSILCLTLITLSSLDLFKQPANFQAQCELTNITYTEKCWYNTTTTKNECVKPSNVKCQISGSISIKQLTRAVENGN